MEIKEPAVSYSRYYTIAQYEQLESEEDCHYDYWHGEIFAMAGASLAHNQISLRIASALNAAAENNGCRVFMEGAKLELQKDAIYVYPDVMMTCHPEDLEAKAFVKHPTILVEVLSESTELYDRSSKWKRYLNLRSLRYLLFVSQKEISVEAYYRPGELALFAFQEYKKIEEVIEFEDLGLKLPVEYIYKGLNLENVGMH